MLLCIVDTWLYLKRYCTWYTLFILPLDTEVQSLTLCNYRTCQSSGGNALWPQEACSDWLSAAEASRCWLWPQLLSVTTWRSIYGETSCQVQHTHTHTQIEKSHFWLSLLISKHFLPIGCITQPVGVSWRFLPANQEFNSTLPIFLMGPCQGRAGLGTASTARSVWRRRIGPMLLTRYDLWLEFRTRAAVLKECCFSSRHWRKHFGRSHTKSLFVFLIVYIYLCTYACVFSLSHHSPTVSYVLERNIDTSLVTPSPLSNLRSHNKPHGRTCVKLK